ncbi:hypothetical protein TRVA0_011S00188 [Trichomonascus vanleenenianus]|uniref:CFEM domain-containing protein n=1 Tax=Trichomonascus vanleenenianus TaxID=2268995 RepID=UPI003ECB68EC
MKASIVSSLATLIAVAMAADNPYASYPSVKHTASINGFADPIYDKLPACAKDCVKESTSNTPCPYWDPGCLCYMPQWGSIVADCFVQNCPDGSDVSEAVNLAIGICNEVGAGKWVISPDASSALAAAETRVVEASTSAAAAASTTAAQSTSGPASTGPASAAGSSSAAGVSSPAVTGSAAATTTAASSSAAAATTTTTTTSAAGSDEGESSGSEDEESSSSAASPTSTSVSQESSSNNGSSTASPSGVEQSNGAGSLVGSIVAPVAAIAGALLLA